MDLSVPSGYESYSYRLDPHDEVDDGYVAKAFRPVSDQQVLLRRRHVRNKRRETFDAVRLCLRIFILLLDLSILSLLIHGVNIWETTYTSVDRNEDGWTRTQWASVKMLSTWLMLVIAAFASFIQMVAIATHLSFVSLLKDYLKPIDNILTLDSPNHYAMAGYIPAPCWPALVLQLQAGLLQLFT